MLKWQQLGNETINVTLWMRKLRNALLKKGCWWGAEAASASGFIQNWHLICCWQGHFAWKASWKMSSPLTHFVLCLVWANTSSVQLPICLFKHAFHHLSKAHLKLKPWNFHGKVADMQLKVILRKQPRNMCVAFQTAVMRLCELYGREMNCTAQ